MADHPTFEETYPKHAFSELVRLGLALGRWILRTLDLAEAARYRVSASVDPMSVHPHQEQR